MIGIRRPDKTLAWRTVYGAGVDQPLAIIDGATGARPFGPKRFTGSFQDCPHYTQDRRGSVVALSDSTGVTDGYAYSPYGRIDNTTGTALSFTGRRYGEPGRARSEESDLVNETPLFGR